MTEDDETRAAPAERFVDADLRGARFIRSDLSDVVMRGVDLAGADLDSPWLLDSDDGLLVNGVDVAPFVDAELDRKFPGRATRRAASAEQLREAWAAVESAWADAVDRVRGDADLDPDESVDGEWSFAQTLRHLVMATDTWLRRAILESEQPYHPLGVPNVEYATDGYDLSVFSDDLPLFEDVLIARADRVAQVRGFIDRITDEELPAPRANPWQPGVAETVLSCLRTILDEEWEHLRYAVRDLDAIGARSEEA